MTVVPASVPGPRAPERPADIRLTFRLLLAIDIQDAGGAAGRRRHRRDVVDTGLRALPPSLFRQVRTVIKGVQYAGRLYDSGRA